MSNDTSFSSPQMRAPLVASREAADAATTVSFARPLVELPGWGDPRLARRIAEATAAGRQQGQAEGYAAGWAQGRRLAAERAAIEAADRAAREEATRRSLTTRTQGMLATLAAAARTLGDQVAPAWDDVVTVLLEGALGLAAAGLHRELATVDAEVLEAARAALRLIPPADGLDLHVNPGDAVLFGEEAERLSAGLPANLRVVPDATVPAGTVVARTPLHSLPMDLRSALRAAEEVLAR